LPNTQKSPWPPSLDRPHRASSGSDTSTTKPPQAFPSRSHALALDQILAALDRGEPFIVATGAPGAGKTTLCLSLRQQTDDRTFVTTVFDPRVKPGRMLANLLRDFGLMTEAQASAAQEADRDALAAAARRFLASLRLLGARAIAIVDDAEQLPAEVLLELYRLSTASTTEPSSLRIVLVGRASLDTVLKRSELANINRTISTRVRLTALGTEEMLPYVLHRRRSRLADQPNVILPSEETIAARLTPDAIERVWDRTGGIPALVNDAVTRLLDRPEEHPDSAPDLGSPVPTVASRRGWDWHMPAAAVVVAIGVAIAMWRGSPAPGPTGQRSRAVTRPAPAIPVAVPAATPPAAAAPTPVPPSEASAQPTPPVQEASPEPTAVSVRRAPEPATTHPPPSEVRGSSQPVGTSGGATRGDRMYRITVASFRSADNAADAVQILKAAAVAPEVLTVSQDGWHKVIVGPFDTLDETTTAQRALEAAGFPNTLVHSSGRGVSR